MASDRKGYPSAEELEFPTSADLSPDATYYLGWQVQHSRLWLFCLLLVALLAGSLVLNLLQAKRYQPTVAYVELDNGYPVIVNASGEVEVDGKVYRPVHLRRVVTSFIENRYGYNWQDLQKINRAIDFMSPAAVNAEREKIREADLGNRIYNTKAVWRLVLDVDNWNVTALGNGRFKVTVPGTAYINDAFRHTDPENPFPKKFTAEVVVATTAVSELNPFGYEIVETGRDIIF